MNLSRILAAAFCLMLLPAVAEERRYDQVFPKVNFREILSLIAKMEEKPVIVEDPGVFLIESSLILPEASTEETRKVLHALLLLNGYELVERDAELHLTQVLTPKQCTALMKGLGAEGEFPQKAERALPRPRVVLPRGGGKPVLPKNRVIVREPEKAGE